MTESDAALAQVVRRQLERYVVAGEDADVVAAHAPRRVGHELVAVGQRDAKARVGQDFVDDAAHLDEVFLGHDGSLSDGRVRAVREGVCGAERSLGRRMGTQGWRAPGSMGCGPGGRSSSAECSILTPASSVKVRRMSAYQAQLRPSDSSSTRSRLLMSMRAACTPSSFQGSAAPGAAAGSRITTGAPLVPRWVRASVRKNPWPWKRMPYGDAATAWRTTGRWNTAS